MTPGASPSRKFSDDKKRKTTHSSSTDRTNTDDKARHQRVLKKANARYTLEIYRIAKIDPFEWYIGMTSQKITEGLLREQGTYAVRVIDSKIFTEIILSVRTVTSICHCNLVYDIPTTSWSLNSLRSSGAKCFETIAKLVEYYKKNYLPLAPPNDKVTLVQPCRRPRWILKRHNVDIDSDKVIGSGNFCNVCRGKLNNKRPVAIKACRGATEANKSDEYPEQEFVARSELIREGHLMRQLRHRNLIKFYGFLYDRPPVMLVMELCTGGSLLNHLTKSGKKISTGERMKYVSEISEGMNYLHHHKEIVHRDLATRNCLISAYGIIKIADFGLSKPIAELEPEVGGKQQIPLRWMAPESLQRLALFSIKSDVWAFGMLLYEIFSNGAEPWETWENKKIATHIRKCNMPELPDGTPLQIRELVKNDIWLLEPAKRLDFKTILERVGEIQTCYPCPSLKLLTLNDIEEVQVKPPEDVATISADDEDLTKCESVMIFRSRRPTGCSPRSKKVAPRRSIHP